MFYFHETHSLNLLRNCSKIFPREATDCGGDNNLWEAGPHGTLHWAISQIQHIKCFLALLSGRYSFWWNDQNKVWPNKGSPKTCINQLSSIEVNESVYPGWRTGLTVYKRHHLHIWYNKIEKNKAVTFPFPGWIALGRMGDHGWEQPRSQCQQGKEGKDALWYCGWALSQERQHMSWEVLIWSILQCLFFSSARARPISV